LTTLAPLCIIYLERQGRIHMTHKQSIRDSGTLLILSLLNNQDMYGYEMIENLRLRSENIFELKEGTLYPLLHRLEKQGHLKSYTKKTDQNRQRKYYQITKKGIKLLEAEKESFENFSEAVLKVVNFA